MTTLTIQLGSASGVAAGHSNRNLRGLQAELQTLEDLLHPHEVVELMLPGLIIESTKPALRHWLIAATDQRLLCIKGAHVLRRRIIDVPHANIRSTTLLPGLFGATLQIVTGQGLLQIKLPWKAAMTLKQSLPRGPADDVATPAAMSRRVDAQLTVQNIDGQSRVENLEAVVERLESDVARLQQQVEFLEELLRSR